MTQWPFELPQEPAAIVTNNNTPHWTAIVETRPNVTLDIGTKLYTNPRAVDVWGDDAPDEWSAQIDAAHPLRTKNYKAWDTAQKMVGHRRSKGALVELVCWLLQRVESAESEHAPGAD